MFIMSKKLYRSRTQRMIGGVCRKTRYS
ncbi:MAG TPA: hypothetical protein DEF25_05100 [Thermoanaerobacter sp.]|nr:hypothetical protein [Thermoanaerobacter sp.]HBW59609.1 hypothetical protein [Thermoanaerobacter sp.]HCD09531.1 hypothetical protein [Thermoanaerobacter sp.]